MRLSYHTSISFNASRLIPVKRFQEARASLSQLPLSFLMQYVKVSQIWTLSIFTICIVSCPNISLDDHVLILSRSRDMSSCMKLVHTRTDFKLHFRCFFFLQVGNIHLMQGEFAESNCFLILRTGACPNFVYVDNL